MKPSQRYYNKNTHMDKVKEHQILNGHFQRLYSQKTAVDNKTPRSMILHPDSRFRKQKNETVRSKSAEPKKSAFDKNKNNKIRKPATANGVGHQPARTMSNLDLHRNSTLSSSLKLASNQNLLALAALSHSLPGNINRYERRFMQQDIIDTRGHYFAQHTKQHMPRTLLTSAESKIAQNRNYHPPLNRQGKSRLGGNYATSELAAKPGQNAAWNNYLNVDPGQSYSSWPTGDTNATYANSTTLSLSATPSPIPSSTQKLSRRQLKPNLVRISPMPTRVGVPAAKTWVQQQIQNEEEELQYYNFVHEVTQDILDRGVYSDRVLKNIFAHHIERRKHDLSVVRMRALLTKLLDDLGVPKDGFFTVHAEQAAHPENVHFDLETKADELETKRDTEVKEWWPGTFNHAEQKQHFEEPEKEQMVVDQSAKLLESSFRSRIHKKEKPSKEHQSQPELELSDVLSLTEDDIDDILNDRNIPKLLEKVNGRGKGRQKQEVTVEVHEYEERPQTAMSHSTIAASQELSEQPAEEPSDLEDQDGKSESDYSERTSEGGENSSESGEEDHADGEDVKDIEVSSVGGDKPSEPQSLISNSPQPEENQYEEDFYSDDEEPVRKYSSLEHSQEDEQDSEEMMGKEDLKETVPGPQTPKDTAVVSWWSSREDGSFDLKAQPINPFINSSSEDRLYSPPMKENLGSKEPTQGKGGKEPLSERQGTLMSDGDEHEGNEQLNLVHRQDTYTASDGEMEEKGQSGSPANETELAESPTNEDLADEVRHRRELFLQRFDGDQKPELKIDKGAGISKDEKVAEEVEDVSAQKAKNLEGSQENHAVEVEEVVSRSSPTVHSEEEVAEVEEEEETHERSGYTAELAEEVDHEVYEFHEDRSLRPLEPLEHPELPPLSPIEEVPETPFNKSTAKQNWEDSMRLLDIKDVEENLDASLEDDDPNNVSLIRKVEVGDQKDTTAPAAVQGSEDSGRSSNGTGVDTVRGFDVAEDDPALRGAEEEAESESKKPIPPPRRRSKENSLDTGRSISSDNSDQVPTPEAEAGSKQNEDLGTVQMEKGQKAVKNALNRLAIEETSEEDEDVCT